MGTVFIPRLLWGLVQGFVALGFSWLRASIRVSDFLQG